MNLRIALVGLVLFTLLGHAANAELILWDDVLTAIHQTGEELAEGQDRQEILVRLRSVIAKNPKSHYIKRAERLRDDLSYSVAKAASLAEAEKKGTAQPADRLLKTKIPGYLVLISWNWKRPLQRHAKKHPDDPVVALTVHSDRSVIEELLPLLSDRSPTHSYRRSGLMSDFPKVPRVCDLALAITEHHAKCRFHCNASTAMYFHELRPVD